jgi:glycosyltransferase involved in cell wall biosynthesis
VQTSGEGVNQRSQILVLTPRFPYPVVGGDRLRIYEICRELARHHDLTLLSLCETKEEMTSIPPRDGIFKRVERVHLPKWRSVLNVLAALRSEMPLQIAYYQSGVFANRVKELLPGHDVCLAHLIRTGHYVRQSEIPTVLEMTDAISMNYMRVRELRNVRGLKSLVYRFEAERLLHYERSVLADFAAVTLVSELDRDFLLDGRRDDNVVVCSNGVDLESLPFRDRRNSEPVIAFIGNMTSIQNLDACFYFAEAILPLVRERLQCSFRAVGRIKPGDARHLRTIEGVEVLGNVVNVADAVGNARVGVAPVRLGAGVQNKVLEYMALGLPVITSPVALEGLQARAGLDLFVAATPEEYVSQLEVLWHNGELRAGLAASGLRYVKNAHTWTNRLHPLVDQVASLAKSR